MKPENKILVKIVIPVYKNTTDEYELKSLQQCAKILSSYPVVFVKPQHLNISALREILPQSEEISFADSYFEGINGYNRLMLSAMFYEHFSDCQYILIYQTDAYVFKDELETWCRRNYDYVGAPWILKPKYHRLHLYLFLRLKSFYYFLINRPFRKVIVGDKVGNGGFSLRKVSSHLRVCNAKRKKTDCFLKKSQKHSEFNEDVFWATQNKDFSYPTVKEALTFSIDDYPELCYQLNRSELPFGCHGWSKPDKLVFWKDKIYNTT
jgi:hypothetical protein